MQEPEKNHISVTWLTLGIGVATLGISGIGLEIQRLQGIPAVFAVIALLLLVAFCGYAVKLLATKASAQGNHKE
jgi:apolipoprotein N-acyltransferase